MTVATSINQQVVEELDSCVLGNLDVIEQGLELLEGLNDEQYQFKAKPYVESSIGEHMRHNLDLYFSLIEEKAKGIIDYDFRRRGAQVERCRQTGINELKQIKIWLLALQPEDIYRQVEVKTEVRLNVSCSEQLGSSMARELIFVAAHAVHHYALIRISALFCEAEIDTGFGYAPATTTYLRGEK